MKYETLLEGLEVMEQTLHDLERTMRLDAEFYSKDNKLVKDILSLQNSCPLTDIVGVSDGNHMSISDSFVEDGVPYYRGRDIYNDFIEMADSPLRIPHTVFIQQNMKRSHLKKGDVLMSIVGAIIGNISLVTSDKDATCSCKLAIIRPHIGISSEYVSIFLQSKWGQKQIQRFRRGSGQTGFLLEDFEQLLIPQLKSSIYQKIEKCVRNSFEYSCKSMEFYSNAENTLMSSLQMDTFVAISEINNVKSLKESLKTSGRLDAEYYQSKYDDLYERLNGLRNARLKDLVTIQKSVEPGSEAYQTEGIPFIRVSNLSKFGLSDSEIMLDKEVFANIIRPQKDTILLSKDGSVGIAYKVEEPLDVITSSAILHLSLKDEAVLPDYLTLVLNSDVVKLQAERDAGGSIIQHWKPSEIENVIIPILPIAKQQELVEMIKQSFSLRKEAKLLLYEAKKIVEDEIETNSVCLS